MLLDGAGHRIKAHASGPTAITHTHTPALPCAVARVVLKICAVKHPGIAVGEGHGSHLCTGNRA